MASDLFQLSGKMTLGTHRKQHNYDTARTLDKANQSAASGLAKGTVAAERPSQDTFSMHKTVFGAAPTLPKIDLWSRKGWLSEYTARDAAVNLWQKENLNPSANDPANSNRFLARLRNDSFSLLPSEDELERFVFHLRSGGKNEEMDWKGMKREVAAFRTVYYDQLKDGLDYLASRYVSVQDKLSRYCTAEELAGEEKKLHNICLAGISEMIGNYTERLQAGLSLSDANASDIEHSLMEYLRQRAQSYTEALELVHKTIAQTYPEDSWLQSHDGFVAAQLRTTAITPIVSAESRYTIQDASVIGQIAWFYQKERNGAESGLRTEGTLALNIAMADMKAELLIHRGLVSNSMAKLLREIRPQSHSLVLDTANRYFAGQSDDSSCTAEHAPIDRSMFNSIYHAALEAYRQHNGNAVQAIRAGAACGQSVTERQAKEYPQVTRWSETMAAYWRDFYTTPEHGELSPSEMKLQQMLSRVGQSRTNNSPYQNYVNDWRGFLTALSYHMEANAGE